MLNEVFNAASLEALLLSNVCPATYLLEALLDEVLTATSRKHHYSAVCSLLRTSEHLLSTTNRCANCCVPRGTDTQKGVFTDHCCDASEHNMQRRHPCCAPLEHSNSAHVSVQVKQQEKTDESQPACRCNGVNIDGG